MNPITPEELDTMHALEQDAVLKPWNVVVKGNSIQSHAIARVCSGISMKTGNAAFICAARAFVPRAVAQLRAQAAELRDLRFTVSAHENRLQAHQQAGAWVPVTERLPEALPNCSLSDTVLVWNSLIGESTLRRYEPDGETWYDSFRGVDESRRRYTHWQPLPAGPVSQQEGGQSNG